MKYGSVCSGIEAASAAWHQLGWQPAFFAEIEPFCSAVLKHYYPEIPNYGDFTTIRDAEPIDVLVAGTPCQSFSVAGRRAGLDDARGVLAFEFLKLAGRLMPRWIVFENVPGLLSSSSGRDFAAFIEAMAKLGYQIAWRVLDAQYFGLAQRRERLFAVGYLGDWRPAAAVLLEPESLLGDSAPSRTAGKEVAGTLGGGAQQRGWCDDTDRATFVACAPTLRSGGNRTGGHRPPGTDVDTCDSLVAFALNAKGGSGRIDGESETFVTHALTAEGFDASEDGAGRGTPLVAQAVAFQESQSGIREYESAGCVRANGPGHDPVGTRVRSGMSVRRLTPRECERLQGFPDDFTLIPEYRKRQKETGAAAEQLYRYYCRTDRGRQHVEMRSGRVYSTPDGPRYRALGNSMAVPVMAWIGRRIAMVERIIRERAA